MSQSRRSHRGRVQDPPESGRSHGNRGRDPPPASNRERPQRQSRSGGTPAVRHDRDCAHASGPLRGRSLSCAAHASRSSRGRNLSRAAPTVDQDLLDAQAAQDAALRELESCQHKRTKATRDLRHSESYCDEQVLEVRRLTQEVEELQAQSDVTDQQIQDLQTQVAQLTQEGQDMRRRHDRRIQEVRNLQALVKQQVADIQVLERRLNLGAQELGEAHTACDRLTDELSPATEELQSAQDERDRSDQGRLCAVQEAKLSADIGRGSAVTFMQPKEGSHRVRTDPNSIQNIAISAFFPLLPIEPGWLFPSEADAPALLTEAQFCSTLITQEDIEELMRETPWTVLADVSNPISFDPAVGGRLGAFLRGHRLYVTRHLQTHWESTHSFPISLELCKANPLLARFWKNRKNRRGHPGRSWKQLLVMLIQVMREGWCDLNMLLDLVFLHFPMRSERVTWYPGHFSRVINLSHPVRPAHKPTTLVEALEEIDTAEPWRNQFRTHLADHPARQIPRLRNKFTHVQVVGADP